MAARRRLPLRSGEASVCFAPTQTIADRAQGQRVSFVQLGEELTRMVIQAGRACRNA
jgi:hypothetical protein